MAGIVRIGASGWSYPHWKGVFYPEAIASGEELEFYAKRFRTVEVNTTFYHQPAYETVRDWLSSVQGDFVFSLKAHRYLTHMKKLTDPEQTMPSQIEATDLFGDRLGPLLFQLPPRWRANPGRLEEFLLEMPGDLRCAFEFRDTSWLSEEVLQTLADHGAALCIYHLDGFVSPLEVTADFVYMRLHGPGGPYEGSYDDDTLDRWAGTITDWAEDGKDVFCYFDNDQNGYAPANAATLQNLLEHVTP